MEIKILRSSRILSYDKKSSDGKFGQLSIERNDFCKSLERPDFNFDGIIGNEKNNSCIPIGTYICKRTTSEIISNCYRNYNSENINPEILEQLINGETFEITSATCGETPNCMRKRVLFHMGNIIEDLEGCIALGSDFGVIRKGDITRNGVINSKDTFALFMQELNGIDEFTLIVEEE